MDDDFPPMPTSLYYNPDENKDAFSIKWRRLKDIIVDDKEIDVPWAVFRMPQPSDISQGKGGQRIIVLVSSCLYRVCRFF